MLQRLDRFRKGGSALAPTHVASQNVIDWPGWWMHGKSWVRPTPRSAQRPAWFQRGDRRQGEPTRATFDDLRSKGLFNRGTWRRWRKRSSHPCLPRARKRRQPEDVYWPSWQWLLGVDPPLIVGQAMEAVQGNSGFPGATTVWGARPPPAYGRIVLQGGGVENICSGGPVLRHAV